MHLEEFAEGTSIWHRMDPRVKIPAVLAFTLIVAFSGDFLVLSLATMGAVAALITAGLDGRKVLARLAVVNGFVLFLWLFLPFTAHGAVVAGWGWLEIRREGILLSLAITMKANAIAAVTMALLGTSSIFRLVHAMGHLRAPASLLQMFFFCYRYLSVIHEEYTRLRTSMRVRCFHPRMGFHGYRSLAYLVGMLFVRSNDRSERIYDAMRLRGFDGVFRTLNHLHMHRLDWIAAGTLAAFLLLLLGIQVPWQSL